jgi:hypothetical protein
LNFGVGNTGSLDFSLGDAGTPDVGASLPGSFMIGVGPLSI